MTVLTVENTYQLPVSISQQVSQFLSMGLYAISVYDVHVQVRNFQRSNAAMTSTAHSFQ